MNRLTNIHNFVRYRSNAVNDFLIFYSLYRYNSNWKHFLKIKNLFYINFFLKKKQFERLRIKKLSCRFLNSVFIFQIRMFINLKLNEYLVLMNYLKMVYLVYWSVQNSHIVIGVNTWSNFVNVFAFLLYLNTKLLKKENYCEIGNVIFRLVPMRFIYNFLFYNNLSFVNIELHKTIVSKKFFQMTYAVVLCEAFFIQSLVYVYLQMVMYFFNIIYFLSNYGNVSSVRKRV